MLSFSLRTGDRIAAGSRLPVVDEAADRAVEIEVDQEMVDHVAQVARWVRGYLVDHPSSTLYSEERVHVGRAFGCPDDLWGTADVLVSDPAGRELLVADAKFGHWEVELEWDGAEPVDLFGEAEVPVERNEQLLLYAIGAANLYGWAHDRYRLAVLQPRSAAPVKECVLEARELEDARTRLAPLVRAALAPDAPLVPTEEGCQFCRAAAVCPALQRRGLELARREFLDPQRLTREQLGELVRAAPMIERGLKSARAHATALLVLGQSVPGLKLVRGTKHRQWLDEQVAEQLLRDLGVREPRPPAKLMTPAQAEKLVPAEKLEPWWTKPQGEPVAAPAEDRRRAIAGDFEPVNG
jgi:hypothetical protein